MVAWVEVLITGTLALIGTYLTVKFKNMPRKKDPLAQLRDWYMQDMVDLRERVKNIEVDNSDLREELEAAREQLRAYEREVRNLRLQLASESEKYNELLERFNALKAEYEQSQKEAGH